MWKYPNVHTGTEAGTHCLLPAYTRTCELLALPGFILRLFIHLVYLTDSVVQTWKTKQNKTLSTPPLRQGSLTLQDTKICLPYQEIWERRNMTCSFVIRQPPRHNSFLTSTGIICCFYKGQYCFGFPHHLSRHWDLKPWQPFWLFPCLCLKDQSAANPQIPPKTFGAHKLLYIFFVLLQDAGLMKALLTLCLDIIIHNLLLVYRLQFIFLTLFSIFQCSSSSWVLRWTQPLFFSQYLPWVFLLLLSFHSLNLKFPSSPSVYSNLTLFYSLKFYFLLEC